MFLGYLFLGIPASYLIDIANRKIETQGRISRYFINVVMYGLAGILALYILLVFMEGELFFREFSFVLSGFIPSLIFYHVLLMLKGLLIIFRGKEGLWFDENILCSINDSNNCRDCFFRL